MLAAPNTDSHRDEGADPRRALGSLGERIAIKHLEARGFSPLERNHRSRLGEIDIIVRDQHTLVFVEVKTRRASLQAAGGAKPTSALTASPASTPPDRERLGAGPFAEPLSSLHRRQMMRLRQLASAWLRDHQPRRDVSEIRIDVIGVLVDENDSLIRLDHLEGVG